ncbi:MAG: Gfo/Idh/MocA family oxidoreductase [Chthoniobacterales bacterium]
MSTYPDTHADYAEAAFEAGCHVFIEKPLAETVQAAQRIVDDWDRVDEQIRRFAGEAVLSPPTVLHS